MNKIKKLLSKQILAVNAALLFIFCVKMGPHAKAEELPPCYYEHNIINSPLQSSLHKKESEENAWKIGGKIHFEEEYGSDYLGLITLNRKTIYTRKFKFLTKKIDTGPFYLEKINDKNDVMI